MARVVITLADKDDGQVDLRAEFDPPAGQGKDTSAQILAMLMLGEAARASLEARQILLAGSVSRAPEGG